MSGSAQRKPVWKREAPRIDVLAEAVTALTQTDWARLPRDLSRLRLALEAEGPGDVSFGADTADLEVWLASCRLACADDSLAPAGLRWPADHGKERALAIALVDRMALRPQWAAEFCNEFFWDEPGPERQLRRLIEEITLPLGAVPTRRPGFDKDSTLLLLGAGGVEDLILETALFECGLVVDKPPLRPRQDTARFANLHPRENLRGALVVLPGNSAASLRPAHLFDLAYLIGYLGSAKTIVVGAPPLAAPLSQALNIDLLALDPAGDWRSELARRLTG